MMKSMQNYYKNSNKKIVLENIAINQYYAGLHQDGYWYRYVALKKKGIQ